MRDLAFESAHFDGIFNKAGVNDGEFHGFYKQYKEICI